MKICSTAYVIKKLQIKTRYYYTSIRMSKIGNPTKPNADADVEQQGLSFFPDGNAKWHSDFKK